MIGEHEHTKKQPGHNAQSDRNAAEALAFAERMRPILAEMEETQFWATELPLRFPTAGEPEICSQHLMWCEKAAACPQLAFRGSVARRAAGASGIRCGAAAGVCPCECATGGERSQAARPTGSARIFGVACGCGTRTPNWQTGVTAMKSRLGAMRYGLVAQAWTQFWTYRALWARYCRPRFMAAMANSRIGRGHRC
jgi:hypothetical protein